MTYREKRASELRIICPESREIALRWAGQEKRLNQCELETRYRWAKDIKRVYQYYAIHGLDGAERLLDLQLTRFVDRTTYIIVATYIDDAFFNSVLKFNSKQTRQYHITWRHLVLLAGVGNRLRRASLFEQCKSEHWSWDTLRLKSTPELMEPAVEATVEAAKPRIATIVRRVESAATTLSEHASVALSDHFAESVQAVPYKNRENTKWKVDTSREAIVRCMSKLEQTVRVFDAALESLTLEPEQPVRDAPADDDRRPLLDWIEGAGVCDATSPSSLPAKTQCRRKIKPESDTAQ